MDRRIVLTKTAKGLMEVTGKTNRLSRELRNVLAQVDGKATIGDLQKRLDKMGEAKLIGHLARLMTDGFVREFISAPQSLSPASVMDVEGDLDFTKFTAAQVRREIDNARDRAEADEVTRAIAEKRDREAREQANAQASKEQAAAAVKAQAEAALKAQADAKASEEAAARRAAEAAARIAETAARLQAEDAARKQAEAAAQKTAQETKQRAEAELRRNEALRLREEELHRREDEQRRREEEQAKRAEQQARAEEEERRRAAIEQKRLEAERQRDEEARKRAEDERKRADEARQRADEERARAEQRIRVEAEQARKRIEDERRRIELERAQADEARKRDEERARAEAEQKRMQAERRRIEDERTRADQARAAAETARKEAEEAHKRAEEERRQVEEARKRTETERRHAEAERKHAEAERKRAEDERQRAEVAARQRAEDEAKQRAEQALRLRTERAARQTARRAAEEEARQHAELAAQEEARRRAEEAEKATAKRKAEEDEANARAAAQALAAEELERRAAETRRALEEETQRAELARRAAEQERLRADEERGRLAEERRIAREERKREEEAAQRASDERRQRERAERAAEKQRVQEERAAEKQRVQEERAAEKQRMQEERARAEEDRPHVEAEHARAEELRRLGTTMPTNVIPLIAVSSNPNRAEGTQAQFERELAEEMKRMQGAPSSPERTGTSSGSGRSARGGARAQQNTGGASAMLSEHTAHEHSSEPQHASASLSTSLTGDRVIEGTPTEQAPPDPEVHARRASIERVAAEAERRVAAEAALFSNEHYRLDEQLRASIDQQARDDERLAAEARARVHEEQARDAAKLAVERADVEARLAAEKSARAEVAEIQRRADEDAERLQREIKEERTRREEAERHSRDLEKAKARDKAESAARARREERARETAAVDDEIDDDPSMLDQDDSLIAPSSIARSQSAASGYSGRMAHRLRVPIGKIIVCTVLLAIVAGVAALSVIGVDKNFYQAMASDYFGQPVKIESASIALSLRPSFEFRDVRVGPAGEFKASVVRVVPELRSLLDNERTFTSVEIIGATLTPDLIQTVLTAKAHGGRLKIHNIEASGLKLATNALELPPLKVSARIDSLHRLHDMVISDDERTMVLNLTPGENGRTGFEFVAKRFAVPFNAQFTLDDFGAKGTLDSQSIDFSQFDARVFDGVIRKGVGRLRMGDSWSFDGSFEANTLELAKIAPKLFSNGRVHGQAKFSMTASTPQNLFSAPNLEGSYTVDRGLFSLGDLARMAQGEKSGGTTVFVEGTGTIKIAANRIQLRSVQFSAGALSAFGSVEVDAQGGLFGRLASEVRAPGGTVRGSYLLGGNVSNPSLRQSN